MKPATVFSAIFFFFALFFITQPLHASTSSKGKIEIVITNHTSQLQLDSIKKCMAAQGVDIDFEMTVYSNKGELKKIKGTVVFSEKLSGTFSNDNVGTITITQKGNKMNIEGSDPVAK